MSIKVDNAIIMAAGTSSRFAPLSYEKHKALIEVRGEVLIERQIRQLKSAGISEIYIVVGYKKEQFAYLEEKFGVKLIENNEYLTRNNNGSIFACRDILKNSYVCSSDNYFSLNPFESEVDDSYYAACYADGHTNEWCIKEDSQGNICAVTVGGENSWFMLGHTFWSEDFSNKMKAILTATYNEPQTRGLLWESIFSEHLDTLKMKIRKYPDNYIFEFDTLDELREFDESYINNTRSTILKKIAQELNGTEKELTKLKAFKSENNAAAGFSFVFRKKDYKYYYDNEEIRRF